MRKRLLTHFSKGGFMPKANPEMLAIQRIIRMLDRLTPEEKARIARYINDRYNHLPSS